MRLNCRWRYSVLAGAKVLFLFLLHPDELVGVVAAGFGLIEKIRFVGRVELRRAAENPKIVVGLAAHQCIAVVVGQLHHVVLAVEP